MSVVPFTDMNAPPLPLGWSEHAGPGGQIYYYNAQTQESTYVRPIPALPIMPTTQSELPKKKKREKPLVKTPVPGTDWIRVKTTEGNIFYSHKVKKESVWTVPEEIKDAIEALDAEEGSIKGVASQAPVVKVAEEVQHGGKEDLLEIERVKGEVQEMVKRKAEDIVPIDGLAITKKIRIEENEGNLGDGESEESEEEEEWQREAAIQLAAEAEAEKKRSEEEEAERDRQDAESERKRVQAAQLHMPDRVDLSIDEAKALFKTLLREKNINPLHPWDTSLPQFISDPRYVLLPSVSVRREAFDEYCRDRARELRQLAVKKVKDAANPREEFDSLLKDEVQSTRTIWTEFRRLWKKDRRFYGWGRDDREREKRFREYVKQLGEKKRAMAERAESDFFALLREQKFPEGSTWRDVKRTLHTDPRYDAVGSSSLREELYNTFLKGSQFNSVSQTARADKDEENESKKVNEEQKQQKRTEKMERAVKERENKVKAELQQVELDIGRSRRDIHKEEGERDFKSLLTDAVRDPKMTWDAALPQLKTDPRLKDSLLPLNQQLHLFHTHVEHLRSKHINNLYSLFEAHATTLAKPFDSLPVSSLLSSVPVVRLGLDIETLGYEFEKWQRSRTHKCRIAFDEMLTENSFVEFWGRLGKIGGEGVDGGVKADEMEEDEGEGGGGKVDMKALAKSVDVGEVEKVLKNDKRYIMFDHVPDQRERWIREYLSNLSAPRLSVHLQPNTSS
ncbi:hypothetical protein BDZ94DRAFT_1298435 [Collybia nuda]|uniref:Transcription elongation regulator 1 n=1 Tax=Collybia nuda TaxID=64659 RepID=A0A9P5Y3H9_9AGAR|nr:hypothetical protein BDZ94DRAFT_1298435 [Collybia nuda]